jgi:chromosome segregation protein
VSPWPCSGGEALTTLALLFPLSRSSLIYLLDEIDALLDGANVDRFNELLIRGGRFSGYTVTHNTTPWNLPQLYGVTMKTNVSS